jgi:aldose 1-epimerase
LVVFTRPELDCIAIEPVSHANNAFNRMADRPAPADTLGVQSLSPMQTFSAHMRIAVQPNRTVLKG